MCLCNGTGGINQEIGAVITFAPCPDSDCTFDKSEADRKYEEWKQAVIAESRATA